MAQRSSYHSLEAHELREEVQDEKPTVTSVTGGEGDKVGEKTGQEDKQGAAGVGSCLVAGAPNSMKDESNPMGNGSGDEEAESQPVDVDCRVYCPFKELEVHQLEHVFLHIKYPGMFIVEDLSINWSATETECWAVNQKNNDLPE